ncbi:ice-binding family protein [Hymenobacter sedentarius]|nr:ice-binding family protein [Hymenobacter sedentarius]
MKKILLLLGALTSLSALPQTSMGQVVAPALGVTSTFAVFTAVGRLDNSGATVVTGDVGTGSTPVTGFGGAPAGTVIGGAVYVGNSGTGDAYATQAATDVAVAYGQMSAITCADNSLTVLGGPVGAPQVLTPNVYCLGAATTLAGDLVLDAQNNPNALFIIKLNGALTTGDLSHVKLINGASAANVYWQVEGAVTLGANSVFRGTLLAHGAISFHTGATLYGRALTTAGAIDMVTNTVAIQDINAPLPVTLTSFMVANQNGHALIKWATASEHNSKSFRVERSSTGIADWHTVADVAAAGTSTSPKQYSAVDTRATSEVNYYRLRSTDLDSTFSYSQVRAVHFGATASQTATAFPNPTANLLTVSGAGTGSQLTLTDVTGKVCWKQTASATGLDLLDTSALLPGTYLLRIISAQGQEKMVRVSKE